MVYQNLELQTAISHCAQLRVAVDIGAHVGITAFRLSQSFEFDHAFEVNTNLFPCLQKNLDWKKCHNVTTHPVGIGEKVFVSVPRQAMKVFKAKFL